MEVSALALISSMRSGSIFSCAVTVRILSIWGRELVVGATSRGTCARREDETFYVLEGEITFYVGDETYKATPGGFVYAPRGVPHSYTFETDVIRMLVLVAPGGFEEFFRPPMASEPAGAAELPPAAEGPPDVEGIVAALEGYGIEVVGPPGPPE